MFIAKINVRGFDYYLKFTGLAVTYEGLKNNATQFADLGAAEQKVNDCPGWAQDPVKIVPYNS